MIIQMGWLAVQAQTVNKTKIKETLNQSAYQFYQI